MELADKLGIKKQNINLWIKGKQNIPKKYLPVLSGMFHLDAAYFQKPLTELDKLQIQKEKLERELQPVKIKKIEKFSIFEEDTLLAEKAIYEEPQLNELAAEIDQEMLVDKFKSLTANPLSNKDTVSLFLKLLEDAATEPLFHKTLEGLAHYLDILPREISSEEEQEEFEEELFEVFDDHNY
ncbi:transcriptional regulator with XRE-family HTH domain [Planomicrobium koreense]|uniref:Transcriptional regulator with XRE-family HTH domain n=1 Tax=Planococcus koreensis TaxID=112331 RepID=A0A7W8CT20_9BACL|nr:helix-turn-helix domain-containing protein [Planococcus koreensis]MBB5181095.1 transcriptional regulator with XRE-family HTH domain [Planococcus koreensis]